MDIYSIVYYQFDNETGKRSTISLRYLIMREEFDIDAIFSAAKEATDAEDLLERVRRLVYNTVEFDCDNMQYIRFKVIDLWGHTNYLKFKKGKIK